MLKDQLALWGGILQVIIRTVSDTLGVVALQGLNLAGGLGAQRFVQLVLPPLVVEHGLIVKLVVLSLRGSLNNLIIPFPQHPQREVLNVLIDGVLIDQTGAIEGLNHELLIEIIDQGCLFGRFLQLDDCICSLLLI